MRPLIRPALLSALLLAGAASSVLAQGAVVHGTVSAATSQGSTAASYSGGLTYRFNRVVGLGVELAHMRSIPSDYPYILCCRGGDEGRATTFTTNLRLEIPTISARVIPFLVGGGGVAATTRRFDVYAPLASQIASISPVISSALLIYPAPNETTSTSMALTLGGGASFLITDHFTVDADLRVLHLLEAGGGRNIGRFGGGVSYRF